MGLGFDFRSCSEGVRSPWFCPSFTSLFTYITFYIKTWFLSMIYIIICINIYLHHYLHCILQQNLSFKLTWFFTLISYCNSRCLFTSIFTSKFTYNPKIINRKNGCMSPVFSTNAVNAVNFQVNFKNLHHSLQGLHFHLYTYEKLKT